MSDKKDSWDDAKEFQREKGETPDSSKEFSRAEHQARNDYQDSGGSLPNRDRTSKSDTRGRGSSDSDSDGGCFVTTACVESMGLPDNCRELSVLRIYRDQFLMKSENGRKAVKTYYSIAPSIVDSISISKLSKQEFRQIYDMWIYPAVLLIEDGHNEEAYALYRQGMIYLAKKYNIKISVNQSPFLNV